MSLDVMILEDDEVSLGALSDWLEERGLRCRTAGGVEQGRRLLEERLPDLALLDLELPDGSGLDLLRELGAAQDTEVVMISGRTTVESAIEALRLGARDFLTKPLEMPRLEAIVRSLARTAELREQIQELRTELKKLGRFGEMVGQSQPMQEVYDCIARVAPTKETVFLRGPSGTGKELAARTLHRLSPRASKPFVAVNCGAVPENLLESQFFGHERGAFTGADRRHQGLFEQADGGTLFLDEITEMPLALQVKLLRVLEEGKVTRLGSTRPVDVDVRLVAATNRPLDAAVEDGKLRSDLLYRLNVFPLELPPLRERGDDVILLAEAFLERLNAEHGTTKTFTAAALDVLRGHDWPGNVRELDNIVRRAFIMAEMHIDARDLPLDGAVRVGNAQPVAAIDGRRVVVPVGSSIRDAEQRLIEATLESVGGNKKEAATTLGISLKTLYARLKLYDAQREGGGG